MKKLYVQRFSLFVLWLLFSLGASAQTQHKIIGVVSDETGQSVIGASVRIKGTTTGAQTDTDGRFSLSANSNSVIVVSYVGYLPQEIPVGTKTEFRIVLKEDARLLNEVVVVGYGTVRKKDLTGSLSSVGAKVIQEKPVANIGEALQGRAAGVQIVNSGTPGSNVSIRVRGLGSINNSDPLLVIDGVPTDIPLNVLNQNDVETVDVLKDASATAIYGSRGANGVVLITTKKGKSGDGVMSAGVNWGMQDATSVPRMLNAAQFASLHNEMMANNNERQRPDFADPLSWGRELTGPMLCFGLHQSAIIRRLIQEVMRKVITTCPAGC
ncbi:TonB-dependent receptor plug domain-containing protein [Arcticibacter sp. MXS-1]|uniref:TonB-dependent receptor plug domain-containing protein n=1 Tax=Arcticibacter sp. MXS-1 TaxID=3341726 RepID=UPI0035A88BD9